MKTKIFHVHDIILTGYSNKKISFWKGVFVKIKFFILSAIFLLISGCSSSRYMVADRLMKESDYQNALDEYIRIAQRDGILSMSQDIRALSGSMIAYYHLGKYKNSFAVSKQILAIDKYNSSAIFYAGMSLEMLNKKTLARKLYRFYTVLSRFDPYYKLIKAKFNQLVKAEIGQRAELAIQMEDKISLDQIEANTIAVLYFLNVVDDPDWNSLSKGLAEMMITDLSQVKSLKVLERIYLQKLLDEMELGTSGLADENTVPRLGRLMKANNLINGGFTIKSSNNVAITANLLDVKAGANLQSKDFNGNLNEIFDIEKQIVFSAIDQMGIQLTVEERKRIASNMIKNLTAFKAFCKGLDEYDLGNFSSALSYFQEATRLDPGFTLAWDYFDLTEALQSIEQGTFISRYFDLSKPGFLKDGTMANSISTQSRLNQLSQNLDLGYLPGNDSRNGASEIIFDERFWDDDWRTRDLLAAPPLPPLTPNN